MFPAEGLMGRPRTFSEEEALDAAIALFWRQGLEATSVRDLADGMGIACPSLYNAFGDKRGLYAAALRRYAETRLRTRIAETEAQNPPGRAVHAFFEAAIERSCSDAKKLGCLMINAAIEAAPHDPELAHAVTGYFAEIEGFFARSIAAAQAQGVIAPDLDGPAAARLLLAALIGVNVMARANPDREILKGMVATALALIEPSRP
jgi:TetR/AcrR family transcriptional regulator, transcriptional repressor for nem operon